MPNLIYMTSDLCLKTPVVSLNSLQNFILTACSQDLPAELPVCNSRDRGTAP